MRKTGFIIAVAILAFSVTAGAQTLEELAEIVRRAASSEGQINKEREAEFLATKGLWKPASKMTPSSVPPWLP